MTVPIKLKELRKKAAEIGCTLETKKDYRSCLIAIIPDLPMSKDRLFNTPLLDGIGVFVDLKDLDKTAKNSRYYKELLTLEERFDDARDRLAERVEKLKACGDDRNRYADICNGNY